MSKPSAQSTGQRKHIPVSEPDTIAGRLSRYIFFALLAYMPLHILLSTWIGTSLNILDIAKVAKEFVLVFGFGLALAASYRKPWFGYLLRDKLLWLIGAFAVLHLLLMAMLPGDPEVELLALVYNTRYLLLFIYAILLAHLYSRAHLLKRALQIIMFSSVLVLSFGWLQHSVLPPNTMERLGYSQEAGALPAFYVDNNVDFMRVFSTQRNPNAYGAYLLIIIAIALAYIRFTRTAAARYVLIGILGLSLYNLLFTYSRSAWVGLVFVVIALIALLIKQGVHRKISREVKLVLYTALAALVIISGSIIYAVGDSDTLQNIVFHSSEASEAESSNVVRIAYWQDSLDFVWENPLGAGPGAAGPVSMRAGDSNINENYYLQIASEVGLIGLGLFLSIIGVVLVRLWRYATRSSIAAAVMASFVGIAATNMFAHTWSYESVAYTWWGLAGIFMVLGPKHQPKASKQKKSPANKPKKTPQKPQKPTTKKPAKPTKKKGRAT